MSQPTVPFNPLHYEPQILKFWEEFNIHYKANKKNVGNKKFYFCDGPPYTSGKVHIGTAWNKALKDSILRYKRMQGFEVLDRAGYDMHGLPTENATEKKLNIKGRHMIEQFGVDKFVKACKDLSIENMKIMNKDFQRLGVWMDFDNAYQSVTKEFIDGEWWLVKQAHEQGRLYEGFRAMAWDWANQTALAKHELEYQNVTDTSIFVKMKVKHAHNEYLIIWTTTPWTIAYNLGIMVHPHVDYVKCQVDDQIWIVAKPLANAFIESQCNKKFSIIKELKGEQLKGIEYIHPFYQELKEHYDKIKKNHPNTHTVILSEEFVDTSSGTGLVHMAPGCGPEDYEVGHRNNVPAWNMVKEDGIYGESMGKFSGRHAIKHNKTFIEDLEELGAVVAKMSIEHQYPHGQRSHQPVIFRTTRQWFFKIEDIKQKLIEENDKIHWVPKAGYNAFNSWLENLRDNSISKQRYWGTPVPIWRDESNPDDYIVVGSIAELELLSNQKVEEPHIPWIDDIVIQKDGKTYKRVPDVLDVWVDAGCASWNSLDFPNNKEHFDKYFPADFILEGKDQIRGWFNLLHIASMIAHGKPSFKAVYMHGFVQDSLGRKMSKSLGNYITPEEVVGKYGADTLRYYMTASANAGVDINYNFEDMKVRHKNLMVLWNIHKYVLELAAQININPAQYKAEYLYDVEEKYILSRLHTTMRKTTALFDEYRLDEAPNAVEQLFLDLSRTYLQLTREKVSVGNDEEKAAVCATAFCVLFESLKLFAPTAPLITEQIYLNLKKTFDLKEESIHLCAWPKVDESKINADIEQHMDVVFQVVQAVLGCREKMQRGIRWPLSELLIVTEDKRIIDAVETLKEIIKTQVNVKNVSIQASLPGIKQTVKPDFEKLQPTFGDETPAIIAHLAINSPASILKHLQTSEKYILKANNKEYSIVKEHLIVQREVPSKYEEAVMGSTSLYLDKTLTDDLEAEGYCREIMRRIQAMRKKAGLQKANTISLFIKVDDELASLLKKWESAIKEKVGASVIHIGSGQPAKEHAHKATEKVKGKEISLEFDIVS